MFVLVWVYLYRVIRLCHPSHYIPLALVFRRGDQCYLLRKLLIRRDKGDTLFLRVQFLRKPGVSFAPPLLPCASPLASLLFSRYLGWQLLNQTFLDYVFSCFRPNLPRFPHRIYKSSGVSCASSPLLRPPRSCPSPPVPGLWPSAGCDGLAGASGFATVVVGYSSTSPFFSRLPTPLYTTSKFPRLSLPSTLISVLVLVLSPVPAPAPVSASIPTLVLMPVRVLPPVPVPVPVTVSFLRSLVPCSLLGSTSSGRRQVLRPKLLATYRRHLLSAEMIPRAE